jgi:hypothetical protein
MKSPMHATILRIFVYTRCHVAKETQSLWKMLTTDSVDVVYNTIFQNETDRRSELYINLRYIKFSGGEYKKFILLFGNVHLIRTVGAQMNETEVLIFLFHYNVCCFGN